MEIGESSLRGMSYRNREARDEGDESARAEIIDNLKTGNHRQCVNE